MTRIQTVFNLLKRVGFAVLLLGAVVQAHTQEMIWARNGLHDSSGYGVNLHSLGDVNNDGFMDFGVESFARNYSRDPFGGYLELFYGGDPPSQLPFRTVLPDTSRGLKFGRAYMLGDINGDSGMDWAMYNVVRSNVNRRVFEIYFDGVFDSVAEGSVAFQDQIIYPMGDFNGDGFDDLYRYYEQPLDYGEVYYGAVVFDTIPDWTMHTAAGTRYQAWPEGFGDLNGDDYQDFVSSNTGDRLNVVHGAQSPDTVPAAVWFGYRDYPTRIVNDLNGDRRDEIVGWGLPVNNINVHFGGDVISQTPDRVLQFLGCGGGTTDIISVGDVNDDSYKDFVLINWDCTYGGKLALYLGSPWLNINPAFEFLGTRDPYNLIAVYDAAGFGDVNGDGVGDFGVGAWSFDTEGQRGRAVVIAGTRNWIVPADEYATPYPRDFQVSAFPNPFNSTTTLRMDLPIGTRNVKLIVTNVLGQTVEQREIEVLAPRVDIQLALDNQPSGIYFAEVQAMNKIQITKLVLLK